MDNEKIAIDEAVAKFRELMEGQLARAKKSKLKRILLITKILTLLLSASAAATESAP